MSVDRCDGDLAEKLRGPVTALRMIVVALASGVLVYAAVAFVVRSGREPEPRPQGNVALLTWMAIGAAPLALVASRILPAIIATSASRQIALGNQKPSSAPSGLPATLAELGDAGALYGVYQTKTIIGAALLEGVAFLSITAFLVEGTWVALGVGVGLAVVILTMFPSAPRAAEWVGGQMRRIQEEQQFGH